ALELLHFRVLTEPTSAQTPLTCQSNRSEDACNCRESLGHLVIHGWLDSFLSEYLSRFLDCVLKVHRDFGLPAGSGKEGKVSATPVSAQFSARCAPNTGILPRLSCGNPKVSALSAVGACQSSLLKGHCSRQGF